MRSQLTTVAAIATVSHLLLEHASCYAFVVEIKKAASYISHPRGEFHLLRSNFSPWWKTFPGILEISDLVFRPRFRVELKRWTFDRSGDSIHERQ